MFNYNTSTGRRNTIPLARPAGSGNSRAIRMRKKKKKLILYRSNVAQFNKLNLSLITITYCSPYTPQYQQKNTTFSSLHTNPLTHWHSVTSQRTLIHSYSPVSQSKCTGCTFLITNFTMTWLFPQTGTLDSEQWPIHCCNTTATEYVCLQFVSIS